MDEIRLRKRAGGPEFEQDDEVVVWAGDDGLLRTTDEDGSESTVGSGGPGGGITEVTSDDDSVTITGGTGPTVDLSVSPGGSVPGSVRMLDLGIVAASDLTSGPVTVYTPEAGEIVGPLLLTDLVHMPGSASNSLVMASEGPALPLLAGWDSDLSRDGYTVHDQDDQLAAVTDGAVIATLAQTGVDPTVAPFARTTWAALTAFPSGQSIIAAGHFWFAGGSGTSGAGQPDFAGNIGGSVVDNNITWFDGDPVAGSAHVYAYVQIPAAP